MKQRTPKLVQLDAFFDEISATQAQSWLAQQGIHGFVEGAGATSAFGGNSLAPARLMIADIDFDRARARMAEYRTNTRQHTSWYCGECQETNEASFDLCWSCHQPREDVQTVAPDQQASHVCHDTRSVPLTHSDSRSSDNPYQPTMHVSIEMSQRTVQELEASVEQAEDTVTRAWKAAILGLIIPLPVLQIYSAFLLVGVDRQLPISDRAQRRYFWAWTVNVVVFAVFTALVARTYL